VLSGKAHQIAAKRRKYLASMAPASSADIKNGAFTKTSLHSVDSSVEKE